MAKRLTEEHKEAAVKALVQVITADKEQFREAFQEAVDGKRVFRDLFEDDEDRDLQLERLYNHAWKVVKPDVKDIGTY